MIAELEDAAKAAGLVDMDMLKIVEPGVPATAAVAELRRQYPGAFRSADARKMTASEYAAALCGMLGKNAETAAQRVRDHIERDRTKGDVRQLSTAEYQRRRRDFMSGLR